MADLYDLLPLIIGYLLCGAAAVLGFCILYEERFNFFSEISLWYILIFGYALFELFDCYILSVQNLSTIVKNFVFCILSFIVGLVISAIRDFCIFFGRRHSLKAYNEDNEIKEKNAKPRKYCKYGQKTHRGFGLCLRGMKSRSIVKNFWIGLLDDTDKAVQLRFINYNNDIVIEGFLLRLSEEEENPYLLLGHCIRYDLIGNIKSEDDKYTQMILKPNDFDEISISYCDRSFMPVELD